MKPAHQIRVIAGQARGIRLKTSKDNSVRPTSDRVRESLFNIIQNEVQGARFLDLYAGTGANGIEALSRGAAACVFAEQSPVVLGLLRENLAATRLTSRALVLRLDLPHQLKLAVTHGPFDLIFADPPYQACDYDDLLERIGNTNLLTETGVVVVEHPSGKSLNEHPAHLVRTRLAQYGKTSLSFYRSASKQVLPE